MRMGRRCAYTECSLIHTHSLTIWTNSYHAEPSGTFYRYDAKAIGSVLRTLKQVMEEKLDAKNVQLASVTKDKGFRVYDDEEMKACVQRIEGEN
jgi:20S proteasome subunit alpha 5